MESKLAFAERQVVSLLPYAKNARTHSAEQVAQIAASIEEFGFNAPVLIDPDGGIIAGHGRVLAAKSLGMKRVPTITLGHLSEAQRRAYVIADNKLALNAGWDFDLLRVEVMDLSAEGFPVGVLGFTEAEIAGFLAPPSTGATDSDDVPEAPAEPITRPGDIWELGRHRLICGDCRDALVVGALLGSVKPHLMVTDPPYGVEYKPDWRDAHIPRNTKRATGAIANDKVVDWRDAWALFPGEVAYVWCSERFTSAVADGLESCEFQPRNLIIWAKSQLVISPSRQYHSQHEPCWYAVRKGGVGHWSGGTKQSTLWQIDKPLKSETGHASQKPVECMKRPIENNSSPGQVVYDPFVGSGTTIIAGEETGRMVYAIELNPSHCDVAVLRWQAFTQQTAILAEDGRLFAEVLAERCPGASIGLAGADKAPAASRKRKRKGTGDGREVES